MDSSSHLSQPLVSLGSHSAESLGSHLCAIPDGPPTATAGPASPLTLLSFVLKYSNPRCCASSSSSRHNTGDPPGSTAVPFMGLGHIHLQQPCSCAHRALCAPNQHFSPSLCLQCPLFTSLVIRLAFCLAAFLSSCSNSVYHGTVSALKVSSLFMKPLAWSINSLNFVRALLAISAMNEF